MTFDPHSLEQLKALGRSLQQELPTPSASHQKQHPEKNKCHPIETEKDPQVLFRELMKASPDGNVPSHLLARLKEIEAQQLNQRNNQSTQQSTKSTSNKTNPLSKKQREKETQEEILYASFNSFLLEDED